MAWSWISTLSTFYKGIQIYIFKGLVNLAHLRVNLYIYQYQVAMLDIIQIRLHEYRAF